MANGTTTNGVAASAQRVIAQNGYNALAAVDSTAAAKAAKRQTTVYYAAGYEPEARKIGQLLGLGPNLPPISTMPTPLPVADLKGANILVLIGPDYAAKQTGATTTVGPPLHDAPALIPLASGPSERPSAMGHSRWRLRRGPQPPALHNARRSRCSNYVSRDVVERTSTVSRPFNGAPVLPAGGVRVTR